MSFGFHESATMIGGLALFVYGLHRVRSGLERASGGGLKAALALLTKRTLAAAGLGFALTVVTQSSSAVAVILVGMVGSGLMRFPPTIPVILGADLATTVTVQILAFDVSSFALLAVALGTGLIVMARSRLKRYIGDAILGFGFLFYGMYLMKVAAAPLAGSEFFISSLAAMARYPILGLLAGLVVTVVVQGSAATIGIVLALAQSGVLMRDGATDLTAAVAIVLGANIGTAATGALAAISADRAGRRVALAQIVLKVLSVALLYPFLSSFAEITMMITQRMGGDDARAVANAHTLFNLVRLVALLPVSNLLANMVTWMYPDKPQKPSAAITYLRETGQDSPGIILVKVLRELGNMTRRIGRLLARGVCSYDKIGLTDAEELRKADREIDAIYLIVVEKLRALAREGLTEPQSEELQGLLYIVRDLEQLGDSAAGRISGLMESKLLSDAHFSMEAGLDVKRLGCRLGDALAAVEHALSTDDHSDLERVRKNLKGFKDELRNAQQGHFRRLSAGVREELESDSILTNLLGELERMHLLVDDVIFVLLKLPEAETVLPADIPANLLGGGKS